MKMHNHTAAVRRAEEVSSKQWTFFKVLFIPLILFVIVYIIYFYTGQKMYKKPFIIYPHPKKKLINQTKPNQEVCGQPVQDYPVIKASNLQTYMVGSYMEHRQTEKMIKTIAIVLRNENAPYQCLLCCNGQTILVPASLDIHSDHFGFEYGTADINCQVPEKCTTPIHVAITSNSVKGDESSRNMHTFQHVKNLQNKETFPYEFTVCISVMYEYDNILEFVQTMEMFKILGAQKVAIYKTNCSSDMQKILDYYIKQNFVELIPYTIASYIKVSRGWQASTSSGQLHYYGQIAALNDCVYRYMYQSRYVALQDLDELILPSNLKTWNELLPELEKKYNNKGGFEFENHYFPLSIKDITPKYSPDSWKKIKGVNILQHIVRMSNDPTKFNNFKVIVNPRLVYKTTVHGILQSEHGTIGVDPQIAHMYHMREIANDILEHRSQIPDPHVRDYADILIPAVSKVLRDVLGIS